MQKNSVQAHYPGAWKVTDVQTSSTPDVKSTLLASNNLIVYNAVIMPAVGKVEILHQGINVALGRHDMHANSDPRDLKIHMPDQSPTNLAFQGTSIGEVIPFHHGLVLESDSSFIVFQNGDNGISVRGFEPPRTRFAPRMQLDEITWDRKVGYNPTLGTFETFGDPALVTVEFLGHPNRDLLGGIISNQRASYSADYTLELERRDITHACDPTDRKTTRVETILFAGPVVDTSINSYLHPSYTTNMDGVEEGYAAQLMLGAKAVTFSNTHAPFIELFGTTIADSDGLIRHYPKGRVALPLQEVDQVPVVMAKLAELSVFARSLEVAPPEHMPMLLLSNVGHDIRLSMINHADDTTFAELREDTGFDWPAVRRGLHQEAVAAEAERLHDAYMQAQLAAIQ